MTIADVLDRLAAFYRGIEPAARVRGDHDLNPSFWPHGIQERELRDAAVLVGLVARDDGPTLLFTERTQHLNAHAGQISFPGGRVEESDADAADTALREAVEEIGLNRRHVTVVGRLDTYVTRTGFRVVPVVAVITPPFDLTIDPFEVAEAFEVPLDFFLSPDLPQVHDRHLLGAVRHFYAFPYGERFIWGATAGMLKNFRDVLLDDGAGH